MLVNGKRASVVSGYDRGLAYGDGVFETIRVARGRPVLLDEHLNRLVRGCERLKMVPPSRRELCTDIEVAVGEVGDEAVIKLIVTRGEGARGYAPPKEAIPTRLVSWSRYDSGSFDEARGITIWLCATRLAINPALAGIKHLNRLEQVMAAAELPSHCFEGLVCDAEGFPVECTRSNLFVVRQGRLMTPRIDRCGVEGVARNFVVDHEDVQVERLGLDDVLDAEEMFVCNSVFGAIPVSQVAGAEVERQYALGDACIRIRRRLEELGL